MAAAARPSPRAKAARFIGAGTDYRLSQMPLSLRVSPRDHEVRHDRNGKLLRRLPFVTATALLGTQASLA